jgi:hypothetical protein
MYSKQNFPIIDTTIFSSDEIVSNKLFMGASSPAQTNFYVAKPEIHY